MNDTDRQNPENPFSISKEAQEEASAAIREVFGSLTKHMKQVADDFAEFDKTRQEMRRRMANGARRTNGRIV
ncbi:MAG: hypothetical protein M3410_18735 [Acidobacteriota bacterium]|nr:hypothetical protein [Acidobacteriota bacterium]